MFRLIRNPNPRKKPPYGSRIDPTHPLAQGLVGCWLFNEGGGNRVYSLVTDYSNTFYGSPTFAADGISFNNNTDYILFEDVLDMRLYDWTVCSSIRPATLSPSTNAYFISKSKLNSNTGRWGINHSTYNHLGVFTAFGDDISLKSNETLQLKKTSIAVRWIRTGNVSLWLDGEQDSATADISSYSDVDMNCEEKLKFGKYDEDDTGYYFSGDIYDVYIYNRALSASTIVQFHAEPYSFILVPQYWYMVDFGAVAAGMSIPVAMHHYQQQMRT